MNRELAIVMNRIAAIALAVLAVSWLYTLLDEFHIESICGYHITFGSYSADAALLTAIFVLLALHARNRYRLGDPEFLLPSRLLAGLSMIAIYDFVEGVFQLGEEVSLLKCLYVLSIVWFIIWSYQQDKGHELD